MNITQGNVFWEKGMNIKYSYPYLTENKVCDVLIIGGGISGALSAYYQAKQGLNVIILEKNLIGFNSTLQNIGVVLGKNSYMSKDKIDSKEIKKLDELTSEAIKDLQQIINEINKDERKVIYSTCNLLNFSDKFAGRMVLSKLYDKEINLSQNIKLIDENENLNIYSALEYESAAGIFNPYILNQELIYMLNNMPNVQVYENTNVEVINSMENSVEVQTTNRFKIEAKKVILATGIDMIKYLDKEDIELYKTYNIVAKLPDNSKLNTLVAQDIYSSNKIMRISNNHVILNGEDVKKTVKNVDELYDEKIAAGKYKKLYNKLLKLLDVDSFKIKNCFYGKYILTKDELPYIDEIEGMPNVYCNLGVGKNGIVYNIIGAKLLKNIYNDCYTKDMYLFRINR